MDYTWIDNATYETLLRIWRFAKLGDPRLQGEQGEYFSKIMAEKRAKCNHVQASKNVGWY